MTHPPLEPNRRRISRYGDQPWWVKMVTTVAGSAAMIWVLRKFHQHTGPLELYDFLFLLTVFLFAAMLAFPREASKLIGAITGGVKARFGGDK